MTDRAVSVPARRAFVLPSLSVLGLAAVIMSISERTVLFHLSNIQQKLQTTSRAHSVAKAAILGLLNADLFSGDPFKLLK